MQSNPNRAPGRGSHYLRIVKSSLIDALIIFAAYTAAFSVRAVTVMIDYLAILEYVAIITVFMVAVLHMFGVYQRIWERTSGHGVTVIFNAVMTATVLIVGVYVLGTDTRPLPLSVILMGNTLALGGFVAVRYRSRLISGFNWRWNAIWHHKFPPNFKRVLIIGAGESGQSLAWRLKHRSPKERFWVVGFIDDDPGKQGMYVEGCKVLGNRTMIESISTAQQIDLIVVAIHNISGRDFREILSYCERTKAVIKVAPDLFALVNGRKQTALLRDVQPEDLIGRSVIARHEAVNLNEVMRKTVLITGAAGSIGSELSHQMVRYEPVKMVLLDNNESGLHDLATELKARFPQIEIIPVLADITISEMLCEVFAQHRPQIVFHAAAYKHVPMLEYYPEEAIRVNVGGTRIVAQLARDFEVERFVFISTDKAVSPSSVMGASKRIGELMLHALSHQPDNTTLFTSVRFGNVLGSRGSVVPTFDHQIASGGPVTVTDPDMTRYFMSTSEAVNLIIHAACLTHGDDIFILKMGEVVRIVELAERMIRLRGLRPYEDIEITFTGVRPGEKLHEQLLNDNEAALETLHPNIIQVDTWKDDFAAERFLTQVDLLIENPSQYRGRVLERFFEMIQADYPFALNNSKTG